MIDWRVSVFYFPMDMFLCFRVCIGMDDWMVEEWLWNCWGEDGTYDAAG